MNATNNSTAPKSEINATMAFTQSLATIYRNCNNDKTTCIFHLLYIYLYILMY